AVTARRPIARWSLGALSHGLWTTFNVGCLVATIALLSVRQREFAWESTILDAGTYADITDAVAWLPRTLGMSAPTPEQVRASRFNPARPEAFGPQDDETRAAWAGLLVGAITVYGLLPRGALLLVSVVMLARARRR